MTVPMISAAQIRAHVPFADAVDALETALASEVAPQDAARRAGIPVAHGELIVMPAETTKWAGAKIVSVNDENPNRNRDRIQGIYLLMDAVTLTPRAIIDGAELTKLRTAALSAVAMKQLLPQDTRRLVIFGTGSQAFAHVRAVKEIRPSLEHVVVVSRRSPVRAEMFAANVVELGLQARIGEAMSPASAIPNAEVVITATSAQEPVFEAAWVEPGTVVVGVGSYRPEMRELPAGLLTGGQVFVEDREMASTEPGDIAAPIAAGELTRDALIPLRDLIRGEVRPDRSRPLVFKSAGMAWEDLVIAGRIFDQVPPSVLRS